MAMIRQELRPQIGVPALHGGEAVIDLLFRRVMFLAREHAIKEGGVGLVLPMLQPGVERRAVGEGGCGG